MIKRDIVKGKKLRAENQRISCLAEFELMGKDELQRKSAEYLGIKRKALSRGKKELAILCNGRLKKINEEIKLRG